MSTMDLYVYFRIDPKNILPSDAMFILLIQIRSSDTSTAESGSEVEEIASPKATRSYIQPKLTPVCEEVSVSIQTISVI